MAWLWDLIKAKLAGDGVTALALNTLVGLFLVSGVVVGVQQAANSGPETDALLDAAPSLDDAASKDPVEEKEDVAPEKPIKSGKGGDDDRKGRGHGDNDDEDDDGEDEEDD